MNQNNKSKQIDDPTMNPSDRLMDSLLKNAAGNSKGKADEDFLAAIELQLDASSPEDIESSDRSTKRKRSKWILGSGIAAAIAAGVSVGIVLKSEMSRNLDPPLIYAATDPTGTLGEPTAVSMRENATGGDSSIADQLANAQQLAQIAKVERDLLATAVADEETKLEQLERDLDSTGKEVADAKRQIELTLSKTFPNPGKIDNGLVGSIPDSSNYSNTTPPEPALREDIAPSHNFGVSSLDKPSRGKKGIVSTPAPGIQTAPGEHTSGNILTGPTGVTTSIVPPTSATGQIFDDSKPMDSSPAHKYVAAIKEGGATAESGETDATLRKAKRPQATPEPSQPGNREVKERLFRIGRESIEESRDLPEDRLNGRHSSIPQLLDNPWKSPLGEPLSTFSIDVDTASWTNIRGMLQRGTPLNQIPQDSIRVEEMINYFDWKYPQPKGDEPFGFAVESATSPWDADTKLLRVAIQGKDVVRTERPAANLVYLLDVSGSMNQQNKLPLVQKSIELLVEEMNADDCISIVVYAGAEGVALHPTAGNQQAEILDAFKRLKAGGSTNGGAGISLAYKIAAENFKKDGINRVILCTDGDFNVGLTGTESLTQLVERKAKRDRVFLSVCGFGSDNLNDSMLESITNKGNGTYYFIDTMAEARKVFLKDMMSTLVTIAKDVKIQVEFNPGQVKAYRLIGYANRRLAAEDFEDDRVDAGEIGAGHSVTAFYELVPVDSERDPMREVTSNLRYQRPVQLESAPKLDREVIKSPELALLKLRYKEPDGDVSKLIEKPVMPNRQNWKRASEDYRFGSAVALFGMKLRGHESVRKVEIAEIIELAEGAVGNDPHGYRAEFVRLLKAAK